MVCAATGTGPTVEIQEKEPPMAQRKQRSPRSARSTRERRKEDRRNERQGKRAGKKAVSLFDQEPELDEPWREPRAKKDKRRRRSWKDEPPQEFDVL